MANPFIRGISESLEDLLRRLAVRKAATRPLRVPPELRVQMLAATHEQVPGKALNHVPRMLTATPDEKVAYGARGHWVQPDAAGKPRDVLYEAAGMDQGAPLKSVGAYRNSAGQLENQPLDITTVRGNVTASGEMDPTVMREVAALERMRAAIDAQEAGAANFINTNVPEGVDPTALLVEPQGPVTANMLTDLTTGLGPLADRYAVSATDRGAHVFPIGRPASPALLGKLSERYMNTVVPGSKVSPGVPSTEYVPGVAYFDDDYNIVPTEPFSGETTMDVLSRLQDAFPQERLERMGASDAMRSQIAEKVARDVAEQSRPDIQNMRRFFAEADWPKAVELMRKGLSPAAALTALGYSASALAAETE